MDKYYSIGKACKMCSVTPRTLRYYEEIGLVIPDRIDQDSGYRYYKIDTLLYVQTIRYLVEQGFSLDEIRQTFENDDIDQFREMFLRQIRETQKQIDFYHQRMDSLKDWCGLLLEGSRALKHPKFRPYVRYVPERMYFGYTREREPGEVDSDTIIATEYFTLSKANGHSMVDVGGAFNLVYDSIQERMDKTYRTEKLVQVMYKNSKSVEGAELYGGFNVVGAYHVGDPEGINATYERLLAWAERHGFPLRGDCIERRVIDIYSTTDRKKYVTEVLLPIAEEAEEERLLYEWSRE